MTSLILTKCFYHEKRRANMKIKIAIQWIIAGLILSGAPGLVRAADTTNQPPSAPSLEQMNGQLTNMTPAQHRAKTKELREKHHALTNAPAQSLTPEQRRAKLKAKVDELEAKKAAGTIKPSEEKELQRLELALKHAEGHSVTNPPAIKMPSNNPAMEK